MKKFSVKFEVLLEDDISTFGLKKDIKGLFEFDEGKVKKLKIKRIRKKKMKDKTYNCKDCRKECRAKVYTPEVVELGLCPQCYTKRMIMIGKINNAKIGVEINLKKLGHDYFQYVRFESYEHSTDREIRQKPYSWVAQTNSEYSHRTVFPMRTSTYVKFFKTLKGAKRNFIKSYIEKELK